MNKKSKKFLKKYLNNHSPSGFELSGQQIWAKYIKPYVNSVKLDNYGNCIASYGNKDSKYKVILDAHADEVSFMVSRIDSNGLIYVSRIGGSDASIAPAQKVIIFASNGKQIKGLFGHPAIHVKGRNENPDINSLFIDLGADTKEEVIEMGIEIGNPIVFDIKSCILNDKYITGKSLDNKVGGFVLANVVKHLYENKIELPYELIICNAVMEETGLYGSTQLVNDLQRKGKKIDLALVVDVTHDTTILTPKDGEQKSGKGICLSTSPLIHNNVNKFIRECLDEDKIPYQLTVSVGSTGTNTDAYALKNIPSSLFSICLKYMHCLESVKLTDIDNCIDSYISVLTKLKEGQKFKYKL